MIIVHSKPYRFLGSFQVICTFGEKRWGKGVKGKKCRLKRYWECDCILDGDANFTREYKCWFSLFLFQRVWASLSLASVLLIYL